MGEVTCALAASHVALADDAPATASLDRVRAHWQTCREAFQAARPTVVVAFLDDHFENFTMGAVPTLAIGVGDEVDGPPPEYTDWLGLARRRVPTRPELARAIGDGLVQAGFEPYRVQRVELGHNFMEPARHLGWISEPVPVVPIFLNVFAPPTMSFVRAYQLGQAVRAIVEQVGPSERVAFLATGGLSHSPLYWSPESPSTPFFERMKRFQHEGVHYLEHDPTLFTELGENEIVVGQEGGARIAEAWDRWFLDALAAGDVEGICALQADVVSREAGNGTLEALTWTAAFGAAGPAARAGFTAYVPVEEWITGVGFAVFAGGEEHADAVR